MPVPAVYIVAAVVGGAVAVIAFKEFVYDPHIAPKVSAWKETRRRQPVLVRSRQRPPSPASSDDDDASSAGVSVEMQDLVARETAEWRSTGENTTLRRRTNVTTNVMDESNIFVPFDTMSPTTVPAGTPGPLSPAIPEARSIATPPTIYSPLPRVPVRAASIQSALESQPPTPQPQSPITSAERRMVSPSARSDSTQSSFTPAVIGPRSTDSSPRRGSASSDDGRSTTYDIVSPPRSRIVSPAGLPVQQPYSPVTSPFSDIQHPLSPGFIRSPSPPVILSPARTNDSPLHTPSESDFAILSPSLRSGMFSHDDDPFEISSDFGSDDMSAWESFGRRTPSP